MPLELPSSMLLVEPQNDSGLGPVLIRALAGARAWVVDVPRAQRLLSFCTDEPCRERWANYKVSPVKVQIAGILSLRETLQIGAFESQSLVDAQEKLLQYPGGTAFQFCTAGDQEQFQSLVLEETFSRLQQFAVSHLLSTTDCEK